MCTTSSDVRGHVDKELARARALHPSMPQTPEACIAALAGQTAELIMALRGVTRTSDVPLRRHQSAVHVIALIERFLIETELFNESPAD